MTKIKQGTLNQVISIQPNSLVSSMLLKKTTGSVTIFAFDKDQTISEHTTPYDALVIMLEGSLTITISEKDHFIKTGEYLIMPAHDPHALKADEPAKMMLVMIKGE